MPFNQRVTNLQPEGAYAVLRRAQELEAHGKDVIHLEVGQPDFDTFPHISQAGIQAIQAGHTRYTPSAGIPALRRAIAQAASQRLGVDIRPSQVVVGPGAKPALFFTTLALVGDGDEVIYPDPGFPTYPAMVGVAGGIPVPVPVIEEKGFSFDLEAFDRLINRRTRLIILNSPANPTGGVIPLADLEHIASIAQKYDCWVISDEIYTHLAYDGVKVPSILSLPGMAERTVVADGFSKTYAMSGWRLGFGIMPETLAERVELLLTHALGCTATFTQMAGITALSASQEMAEAMAGEYQRRRDQMVRGLNAIPGVHCTTPQGAIYAFPNVKAFGLPSRQLAARLLEESGVALLAGTDFGEHGEGYLRLCFAVSPEEIDEALERISAFLHSKPLVNTP